MSREKELLDKHQSMERKLKEMAILSEKIERGNRQALEKIAMSPEQLNEYMENPNNFTPDIWEELQKEKEKIDMMLNLQLSVVNDTAKNKKKYSERGRVQPHWLFVR